MTLREFMRLLDFNTTLHVSLYEISGILVGDKVNDAAFEKYWEYEVAGVHPGGEHTLRITLMKWD